MRKRKKEKTRGLNMFLDSLRFLESKLNLNGRGGETKVVHLCSSIAETRREKEENSWLNFG